MGAWSAQYKSNNFYGLGFFSGFLYGVEIYAKKIDGFGFVKS